MTNLKRIIGVVVVSAAAIIFTVQHQTGLRLREENASLRQQLERMTRLEADNERLSNLVAQAEGPLASKQLMDVLKLRGEVALLRRQTNELQTLRERNRQLQTALAAGNNSQKDQATNLPPKVPPVAVFPKAAWAFAG